MLANYPHAKYVSVDVMRHNSSDWVRRLWTANSTSAQLDYSVIHVSRRIFWKTQDRRQLKIQTTHKLNT